jgi:hypothetical protein
MPGMPVQIGEKQEMPRSLFVSAAGAVALMAASIASAGAEDRRDDADDRRIKIGREIAPVELDLDGKDRKERKEVWLGSYIVNAQGGCNDCHTNPPYAEGGNPFLGEEEQINVAGYLCGGMDFGIAVSADISPDEDGLPAGLERREFIRLLRTGEKDDGELLQVMPWPVFGKMTRRDLSAVYAYLSAIPSCEAEP